MAALDEVSEARLEAKRDFAELLDSDYGRETGEGLYVKKIDDIIKKYSETKTIRLDVDVQGVAGAGWVGRCVESESVCFTSAARVGS